MVEIAQNIDARAIAERLDQVRERIARACERAGRPVDDVKLIGVTKTFPIEVVHAAWAAGLARFGENRVQDLVEKASQLPGLLRGGDVEWFMIGHLQRNKAKDVVEYADAFQALDSKRLAKELDRRAESEGRAVPCLVQVNVSGEESKSGLRPNETHAFLDDVGRFEHLRVEGLMTIGSFVEDPEDVRSEFRLLRKLYDTYDAKSTPNVRMRQLSMGMSGDFEVAIAEGATHVRIGSAIFGERNS